MPVRGLSLAAAQRIFPGQNPLHLAMGRGLQVSDGQRLSADGGCRRWVAEGFVGLEFTGVIL